MVTMGDYKGGMVAFKKEGEQAEKVDNRDKVILGNTKTSHWTEPFELNKGGHRYAICYYTHKDSVSLPLEDPVFAHLFSTGICPYSCLASNLNSIMRASLLSGK